MTQNVLCIGECMVEFSPQLGGSYAQGFAGDTLNMAWYLRRCLPADWTVDYFTALGDDPMSDRMAAFMENAQIGTRHIPRLPGLAPGLYVISLKDSERSFSYWRGLSAARQLANDAEALGRAFEGMNLLVFSGITLAILPERNRQTLLHALATARAQGSRVAFDPNIRPRLWESPQAMRDWITRGAGVADDVLPSFDDEAQHFGDASPPDTAGRYLSAGAGLVVVKNGAGPVYWRDAEGEGQVLPPVVADIIDTTAAGDSFNAGFLAAQLSGKDLPQSIALGSALAARVIQARGALVAV